MTLRYFAASVLSAIAMFAVTVALYRRARVPCARVDRDVAVFV